MAAVAGKAAARFAARIPTGRRKAELSFDDPEAVPGSSRDQYLPSSSGLRYWCTNFNIGQALSDAYSTVLEGMGFEREKPEPFDLTLLSSRQLRQLKWAFNVLDEDGSGSIQGHELEGVIQLIGDNPSKKEAKELLAWLDTDGDGEVSFEEFAHAWWQRPVALVEAEEGHDELALAFMIFDADHVRRTAPAPGTAGGDRRPATARLRPPC